MQAVRIVNGALKPEEAEMPQPGDGQVLIRVVYAGINRADLFQVEGNYPAPEETQMIPGMEVSGVVEKAGAGVAHVKAGDCVAAWMSGGGYADYALAYASHCIKVDEGELENAAALPEALITNWMALKEKAQLMHGETVLIHAAASGIGLIGIQMAKQFGARVIATAGSEEKCRACETLGAETINYRREEVAARVKALTGGKGVNVLIDVLGGKVIAENLKCLTQEGRMVSLAFLEGPRTEGSLGAILTKNITWCGMTVRSQPKPRKDAIFLKIQDLWPAVASGAIRPRIDSVFDLKEAEKAHARMRERLHIGKILLKVR